MKTILISVEDHYYHHFFSQFSNWLHHTGFTYATDIESASYNFTFSIHAGPTQPLAPLNPKPRHNTNTMVASDKGLEFGYAPYSGWKDENQTVPLDRFLELSEHEFNDVLVKMVLLLEDRKIISPREAIELCNFDLKRVYVRDSDGDIHKLTTIFPEN